MNQIADPKIVAEMFAREQSAQGFALDFSLRSLIVEVDKVLDSPEISGDEPANWKSQAGLEAYVGESLCRLFDGKWGGEFCYENPGPNFYLSYIEFGSYRFFPSYFLAYRISNGEKSTGTFKAYLEEVLPAIQARQATPKNTP